MVPMEDLHAEVIRLRKELAVLKREKAELELLMDVNIEYSDFIEEDLLHHLEDTKKRLFQEIAKLRVEIRDLYQRIANLQREKADLELLINLNLEYSDFIEEDLLTKVESTLRESERQFRLLSETIPVPILVTRVADAAIVFANKPASELLGLPFEQVLGCKTREFYTMVEQQALQNILNLQGQVSHHEMQIRRRDGNLRWVALSAQFLTFKDIPCLLNALYDLTDWKQAEEKIRSLNEQLELRVEERTGELRQTNQALRESLETLKITQEQLIQAEKSVALAGLVAGIAHEINNPVGLGVTSASYLEQQTQEMRDLYEQGNLTRSALKKYLQSAQEAAVIILRNLQRAAEQVKSFKQVAVDQTSGEKRQFNLKAYIDDLMLSLHPKFKHTGHTISIQCPENITITSYPGAFSQIITNLVINTLNHGFEEQEQGEILLKVTYEQEMLRLEYCDNGKGMTSEERSRAFDAFYTTKRGRGGTGLGLHIVYNLVTQKLEGEINCESVPGMRTTFIIQIPIAKENQ